MNIASATSKLTPNYFCKWEFKLNYIRYNWAFSIVRFNYIKKQEDLGIGLKYANGDIEYIWDEALRENAIEDGGRSYY